MYESILNIHNYSLFIEKLKAGDREAERLWEDWLKDYFDNLVRTLKFGFLKILKNAKDNNSAEVIRAYQWYLAHCQAFFELEGAYKNSTFEPNCLSLKECQQWKENGELK